MNVFLQYHARTVWNHSSTHTNILDVETEFERDSTTILKLWVMWLCNEIKIKDDGLVYYYAEFFLPGWLLLQIGRSLWPNINDVRKDGRRTSISVLNLLRRSPDNGYLVDKRSFYNWLYITNYDGLNTRARFYWIHQEQEIIDEKCYQILAPTQVQPGMTATKDEYRCWVEIPDINLPIPLWELLDL